MKSEFYQNFADQYLLHIYLARFLKNSVKISFVIFQRKSCPVKTFTKSPYALNPLQICNINMETAYQLYPLHICNIKIEMALSISSFTAHSAVSTECSLKKQTGALWTCNSSSLRNCGFVILGSKLAI